LIRSLTSFLYNKFLKKKYEVSFELHVKYALRYTNADQNEVHITSLAYNTCFIEICLVALKVNHVDGRQAGMSSPLHIHFIHFL
jgi:hypothetical protein